MQHTINIEEDHYIINDEKIEIGDEVIAKCNDIQEMPDEVFKVTHIYKDGSMTDGIYHFKYSAFKIVGKIENFVNN